MNRKQFFSLTWIEVAVVLCMLLIIAGFFLSKEFYELERGFLVSLGWSENIIYLFTVPLVFLIYLSIFKREKASANKIKKPIVRKSVLIFAAVSIVGVILYLLVLTYGL